MLIWQLKQSVASYVDLEVAHASDIWWTLKKLELVVHTDQDMRLLTQHIF